MGGLLILSALMTATLLWARLDNVFVWVVLLVTVSWVDRICDDYAKVSKQNTAGFRGKCALDWVFDCGACALAGMGAPDRFAKSTGPACV